MLYRYWCSISHLRLVGVQISPISLASSKTGLLRRFATWVLLAAATVLVVQLLGVDVRSLLMVTGGSSIVAGLASQQLLTNAVSFMQMHPNCYWPRGAVRRAINCREGSLSAVPG
ncbi:hypothetical protein VaNZ11_002845 [Volvox africanus]|uniref:Uncharacterized protein n=1 Tax=Volvox africanus TaxID=51714 RepID=A0ABQ5RSS6_9CHLO|nr:hypothetical protein VaNZ11_002845 [Volvox africanus]